MFPALGSKWPGFPDLSKAVRRYAFCRVPGGSRTTFQMELV